MDALRVFESYSLLQRRLIENLLRTTNPRDRVHFRDLAGTELVVDGVLWTYKRHGAGIIFRSNVGTVDAHVRAADYPDGVDAWRLMQYSESRGFATLEFARQEYPVEDESALEDLLAKMAATGSIRATATHERLYLPR